MENHLKSEQTEVFNINEEIDDEIPTFEESTPVGTTKPEGKVMSSDDFWNSFE